MKTFDSIRARLAGLQGPTYWRSLEELADTPEFRAYVAREFPSGASEFIDPAGRRRFLKLMGASLALAGVSACTRQPDEQIIPYVRQPEEVVPGNPLFFATSMPLGGFAMPLLAENHMGRPTKLEGNPDHPASLGATDIFGQASVLSLYNPNRSRTVINRGDVRSWGAFVSALQSATQARKGAGGDGLRLLTEPVTSPSLLEQIEKLLEAMPAAKWHQWDPVFGAVQGGAPAATPLYHFDKADVVVALDADFLGCGPASLRYQKDFASRRRIRTPQDPQNRLYAAEPAPTVTGTKAEHRLPAKAGDIHGLAAALAAAAGVAGGAGSASPSGDAGRWLAMAAADLQAHRGRSVVVAGERQPAAVHALARALNEALGNVGSTVVYAAPIAASPADGATSIAELAADMNAGRVSVLVIVGGNPLFTAPADTGFAGALTKMSEAGTVFHVGLYHDETAEQCHWHVPEAHYLESWGDARSFDGTVSLIQPLIAPLYGGRQAIEVMAALNGAVGTSSADIVKDYWSRAFQKQTKAAWAIEDRNGAAFSSFDQFWRHALHDGFIASTSVWSGTSGTPGYARYARYARCARCGGRADGRLVRISPLVRASTRTAVRTSTLVRTSARTAVRTLVRTVVGSRLPPRSHHPRREVREQRLAAGIAEAHQQGDLGQRRVRERADGGAARHPVERRGRPEQRGKHGQGGRRDQDPESRDPHAGLDPAGDGGRRDRRAFRLWAAERRPGRHEGRARRVRAPDVAGALVRRRRDGDPHG